MNCPKCHNWNKPGSELCSVCQEVLMHSASRTVLRRQHEQTVRVAGDGLLETTEAVAGALKPHFKQQLLRLWNWIKRHHNAVFILGGVLLIAFGTLHYLSPLTRLDMYGVRLPLDHGQLGPETYLVGFESKSKSWAEADGRLDTPLLSDTVHETGSVTLELVPAATDVRTIHVNAKEWIRAAETGQSQVQKTIPADDPSVPVITVLLDKDHTLAQRDRPLTLRTGRAVTFLLPHLPKGTQRKGSAWTEDIEWAEIMGEWKIGWKATVRWQLKEFENCAPDTCARLVSTLDLEPRLLAAPAWAKGSTGNLEFRGNASGQALYNVSKHTMISHSVSYAGNVMIGLTNLEVIPQEQRVGRVMSSGEGTLVLEFSNKVDVRAF